MLTWQQYVLLLLFFNNKYFTMLCLLLEFFSEGKMFLEEPASGCPEARWWLFLELSVCLRVKHLKAKYPKLRLEVGISMTLILCLKLSSE